MARGKAVVWMVKIWLSSPIREGNLNNFVFVKLDTQLDWCMMQHYSEDRVYIWGCQVLLMNSPLDPIPHLSQSHVQKRHGPAKLKYYVHISKQFAKYDMKRGHEHGIMAVYHDLLTEIMCKRRGLKLVWKSNHYQSASSSITKRTWKGRSLQHGTTMFSMANG